ncbi:hypothetical protein Tco_0392844 [Tanacetum coccineum]
MLGLDNHDNSYSVLNRDISIDSSPKIDSLSNEFAGEFILPKSIPPEIEEVEFDTEGDILFLESLLYDNYTSPHSTSSEALQANSNAIEISPPSHIPLRIMILLWRRLTCCADDDHTTSIESDEDCPDYEDSQFCHSSRVQAQLQLEIRYPNLID